MPKTNRRQRQSSSDDNRPPTKKRQGDFLPDDDDDEIDYASSIEEENQEELVQRLVDAIEVAGSSKSRTLSRNASQQASQQASKGKQKSKNQNHSQRQHDVSNPDIDISSIIEETVKKALCSIIPIIKDVITEAMEERTKKMETKIQNLQEQVKRNRIRSVVEADRAEQYSRRDNLIVTGIIEEEEEGAESMINKILEVCHATEAKVKKEDIAAIHRLGKKQVGKNRSIIIRTTRLAKQEIIKKKKNLKNNQTVANSTSTEQKVYINEDITEPRRKLQGFIRDSGSVDYCFVREGTIVCKKGERFLHVNDADDLFKLGISEVEYNRFYKDTD